VFPRVHQRPPFIGNGAVSFRVREAPLIHSVRDSASFSCPTGPSLSAPLRLFPHVEHPSNV
jgi:hypothetical protein